MFISKSCYTLVESSYLSLGLALRETHSILTESAESINRVMSANGNRFDKLDAALRDVIEAFEDSLLERECNTKITGQEFVKAEKSLKQLKHLFSHLNIVRLVSNVQVAELHEEKSALQEFNTSIYKTFRDGNQTILVVKELFENFRELSAHSDYSMNDSYARTVNMVRELVSTVVILEDAIVEYNEAINSTTAAITDSMELMVSLTSQIISAVQFQDAYRQRLEHIDEICNYIQTLKETKSLPQLNSGKQLSNKKLKHAVSSLEQLKNIQLQSLSNDARSSIWETKEKMDTLVKQLKKTTSMCEKLARATDQSRPEHVLNRAVKSQKQLDKTRIALEQNHETTNSVFDICSEIKKRMISLAKVNRQVFITSLNAAITTARVTGPGGAALSIIAEEVSQQSKEIGEVTTFIQEEVIGFINRSELKNASSEELSAITHTAVSIVEELPKINKKECMISKVNDEAYKAFMTASDLFAESLAQLHRAEQVVDLLLSHQTPGQKDNYPEWEELTSFVGSIYTMNSERVAHGGEEFFDEEPEGQDIDDIFF